MNGHRLPGMSISAKQWAALTAKADELGVTRTELIRHALEAVTAGDSPAELKMRLDAVQRRLDTVRAAVTAA